VRFGDRTGAHFVPEIFRGARLAESLPGGLLAAASWLEGLCEFLNWKTFVGATNYVRTQYSHNPGMFKREQNKSLRRRLTGGP
jgi:hypothetical protein